MSRRLALCPQTRGLVSVVAMNMRDDDAPYHPLDEVLAHPATRLLRALRWFDWVQTYDLFAAAGVPDYVYGFRNVERDAASSAMSRLVKAGHVERSGKQDHDGYAVRITPSGRRELELRLRGESTGKAKGCKLCGAAGHYAKSCRQARAA